MLNWRAALKWISYVAAFALGGYFANGLPWFQWLYGELARALAHETFRTLIGSWPLGLVLVSLVFRDQVSRRIADLVEVAVPGAKAKFKPQQQSLMQRDALPMPAHTPSEKTPVDVIVAATPAAAVGEAPAAQDDRARQVDTFVVSVLTRIDYPWVIEQEKTLREFLGGKGVLEYPEQAVRVLLRQAALWLAVAHFENTYGIIWGGQVALLRDMQEGPLSRERAEALFDEWHKRHPGIEDSLSRWVDFLIERGLIEADEKTLTLTARGSDFLRFLAEFKRNDPERLR